MQSIRILILGKVYNTFNVEVEILSVNIICVIGGDFGAFSGGFAVGLATNHTISESFQMALKAMPSGMAFGGSVGLISNVTQNILNNRNWFTGSLGIPSNLADKITYQDRVLNSLDRNHNFSYMFNRTIIEDGAPSSTNE